jgi:hypothetical protein
MEHVRAPSKGLSTEKKIASVGAANQVFVVVAKYTGTAQTASTSEKLAARKKSISKIVNIRFIVLRFYIVFRTFGFVAVRKTNRFRSEQKF